ncbi:MAG: DUF1592 domain-containing protein [Myxococcales bacterium]|nr:DUF1592 domain-containing protein [Myxococcales bacterium]
MLARRIAALLAVAACRGPDPAGEPGTTGADTTDPLAMSSSTSDTTTGDPAPAFTPGPPVLPRLTRAQYFNSLRDIFGPDLPTPPLEPDQNPHLFDSIGAATTTLSELGAQQYEEAADLIAAHIFDNSEPSRREALVACDVADATCTAEFLARVGRRLYRRPLTEAELSRWTGVAAELALGDPWRGLRFAVAGLIQSPHFLYRVEPGHPDSLNNFNFNYYDSYEMAARLSFLLLNTGPDDVLLDAAERGELGDAASLRAHAERMLADPRARVAVQEFFAQLLDLRRLDAVVRDPAAHPRWTPTLAAAMRREVELLVDDHVFRRDADILALFNQRHTFVNADLAALYGVAAEGADAITYVPVDLPGERAGVLSLAAFLTLTSHPVETSPTRRGKYLRERILCQTVPPPPPGVDASLDPPEGDTPTSVAERLLAHRSDPVCAGCHDLIDPPGLLFEHFDPIGAWRDEALGLPVDAAGGLDGLTIDDASELADLLAADPRVARCLVTQLHRHASGRLAAAGELPALDALDAAFADHHHSFRALLLDLVTSDAFRAVAPAEEGP